MEAKCCVATRGIIRRGTSTHQCAILTIDADTYISHKREGTLIDKRTISYLHIRSGFLGCSTEEVHLATYIESQIGCIFSQTFFNLWHAGLIGTSQNNEELLIKAQWTPAKLCSRGREIECCQRIVAIRLSVPAKIHVNQTFTIEAISHPGMTACPTSLIARDIERKAFAEFVLDDLQKMSVALILLGNNGSIVIEIRAKGLCSSKILCAATIWRVLHIDRDSDIAHQFCHSIFLLRRVRTMGVSGTHLLPSILRLRKISRARLTFIINGVTITSLTAQRPLMVVHDLSHRRGYTPRIVVGELIVRFTLSPARFDKRGNGIGRLRGVRRLSSELRIIF